MAGSYVPRLYTGAPSDSGGYLCREIDGIRVFYAPALQAKSGDGRIRIRLKNFLFMRWLELEGARVVVCAPAEEPVQERK